MRFRVLGPVDLADAAGADVRLGSAAQRTVLARLLCTANRPVTSAQLLDAVWGAAPPPSAQQSLRVYVHHLRRRAGLADRLRRDAAGLILTVRPGELDAQRFEQLAALGRRELGDGRHAHAAVSLRHALALWRGGAYDGVAPRDVIAAEVRRLEDLRVTAQEDCFEAELAAGARPDLVAEIGGAAAAHPLRERLRGQLMRALHLAGRQAEAIEVYEQGRQLLADELGVDPTPELRELHLAILRGAAVVPRREMVEVRRGPALLPPDNRAFTGRADDLDRLDRLTPPGLSQDAGTAMRLIVICGPGGIGKTTLAVHWAHAARERFPDGQLYVNLRGFDLSEPVPPAAAVADLLRLLDVERNRIPDDVDAAAAMLRDTLSGRRVLLVLDNAVSAEQVRPLLPADPHCVVVVTSRDRLSGLVARDGAHRIELATLSEAESIDLLARMVGRDRVEAERVAAVEVVAACGHLPLAICVAGAGLLDEPGRRIADYRSAIGGDDRLDVLAVSGDPASAVRAVFGHSYARLTPAEQRTLRLFGVVPGPDLTESATAAALGYPVAEASRLLDRLAQASLAEQSRPGRYSSHDLIRLYARELSVGHDSTDGRAATLRRLSDYYIAVCARADGVLRPQPDVTTVDDMFADQAAAVAWFDNEYPNVAALLQEVDGRGWHDATRRLARTTRGYLRRMHRVAEWERVYRMGLAAAEADGDRAAAGDMHDGLADMYFQTKQWQQARAQWEAAASAFHDAADEYRWALCHDNLGIVDLELGDAASAERHHLEALATPAYAQRPKAAASTYIHLGIVYGSTGRYRECEAALLQALELSTQAHHWELACYTRHNLAQLGMETGDLDSACAHAEAEIALAQECRLPVRAARGHELLAEIFADKDSAIADGHRRAALRIYESIDHPSAATVRAALRHSG